MVWFWCQFFSSSDSDENDQKELEKLSAAAIDGETIKKRRLTWSEYFILFYVQLLEMV